MKTESERSVRASRWIMPAAAFLLCLIPLPAPCQTPRFDAASVKANVSQQTDPSKISSSNPGRFVATNAPLRFLILYAYQLLDHQLIGVPDWTAEGGFDVIGTYSPERRPSDQETRIMLQNLLADRFDLKAHHEQRELTTYALMVARKDGRLGPQIHRSDVDCAKWIAEQRPKADAGGPSSVSPSGKRPACMMIATRKFLTGGTRTMEDLTRTLQSMLSRPVIDRTGLTGGFDIDLQWYPTDLKAEESANASPSEGPSIFTAVQEQLGLRLVSQKARFDVMVIDSVTHPTSN